MANKTQNKTQNIGASRNVKATQTTQAKQATRVNQSNRTKRTVNHASRINRTIQNTEWTHSFQVYRRAEKLCHFLFRNMSGSVFIPESTVLRVVSEMCEVLKAHDMPYRTPELLLRLQTEQDGACALPRKPEVHRIRRFCKNHADHPADPELYELYRSAEVFTAAFDCGKLLCCDEDQHMPWSTPLVMELTRTTVAILQAEGYPAEIPSDLIDNHR